jgi:hypothetical protein
MNETHQKCEYLHEDDYCLNIERDMVCPGREQDNTKPEAVCCRLCPALWKCELACRTGKVLAKEAEQHGLEEVSTLPKPIL